MGENMPYNACAECGFMDPHHRPECVNGPSHLPLPARCTFLVDGSRAGRCSHNANHEGAHETLSGRRIAFDAALDTVGKVQTANENPDPTIEEQALANVLPDEPSPGVRHVSITMTHDEWRRVVDRLVGNDDKAWPADGPITSTIYEAAGEETPETIMIELAKLWARRADAIRELVSARQTLPAAIGQATQIEQCVAELETALDKVEALS